jgi:hypothetical protein
MSDKLPFVRLGVHLISSIGVSKIVNDIIRNNTDIVTTADAVKVWTGSIVIGSIIAENASKHVNNKIDAVIAWHEDRKDNVVSEQ